MSSPTIEKVYMGVGGAVVDFFLPLSDEDLENIKSFKNIKDLEDRGIVNLELGVHYHKRYPLNMFLEKFPHMQGEVINKYQECPEYFPSYNPRKRT